MRAKEYLDINKSKILYYDIVKAAIDALSLLRNDNRKTEESFNQYLFSDARFLANEKEFILNEGEVDFKLVQEVRNNIMNSVCQDESYIFTYSIIAMQKNLYHNLTPLNFCEIKDLNSIKVNIIVNTIKKYYFC